MSTRTTLTDRYVWSVSRHLSADTGPDVARELRASIGDAVDAKVESGVDHETAELEAITELGDPDVLARQYGGRPAYLIGPGVYPDWLRLVRLLLPIILPIVVIANLVNGIVSTDDHWGEVLLDSVLLAFTVGVNLVFWITVTFAIIEWARPESERGRPLTTWKPDSLDDVPDKTISLGETLVGAAFSIGFATLVAWQFTEVGDNAVQVLNPDVDLIWKVAIVGLIALDVPLAIVAWVQGRWTPSLAAVNVLSNAAYATLVVWLIVRGELLTDLPAELGERFGWPTNWSLSLMSVAAFVVVIAAWDGIDSVLKARRSHLSGRRW